MVDLNKGIRITAEGLADDLVSFADREVLRFVDECSLGGDIGVAYKRWVAGLRGRANVAVDYIDWVGYLSNEDLP